MLKANSNFFLYSMLSEFEIKNPCVPGSIPVCSIPVAKITLAVLLMCTNVLSEVQAQFNQDLVFMSSRTGNGDLYRYEFEHGMITQWTDHDSSDGSPRWDAYRQRIVFASVRNGTSQLFSLPGEELLFDNPAFEEVPDWSPDGLQIVYTARVDGNSDIFIADASGQNPVRLTQDPAVDKQPRWSPDGRKILFVSDRNGGQDLYLMDPNGSNLRTLTQNEIMEGHPSWSGDGEQVLFYQYQGGDADMFSMRISGEAKTNLTQSPANELIASWSADNQYIAFGTIRDDNWEIYVMKSDGSEQKRITDHAAFDGDPIWVPVSKPFDLGALRWKNRILLTFAPDQHGSGVAEALNSLDRNIEAFIDRDMIHVQVYARGASRAGEALLSSKDQNILRNTFGINPTETVFILIGKDGGEKWRQKEKMQVEDVFALIDSMPMRRQEMRRN